MGRSPRHGQMVHRTQTFLRRATGGSETTLPSRAVLLDPAPGVHPPAPAKVARVRRRRLLDRRRRRHVDRLRVPRDHVQRGAENSDEGDGDAAVRAVGLGGRRVHLSRTLFGHE